MTKRFFIAVAALVSVSVPFATSAATFKTGQSYSLASSAELNDNLYASGGTISIAGKVNGDAMIAGGTINVSGPVSGSVMVAGGNVGVSGDVGGSLRAAGGSVTISQSVGQDLVAAGGQVNLEAGTTVAKDVAVAGGSVYIDAKIDGNLKVIARQVTLGPDAFVKGSFEYTSEAPVVMNSGAVIRGRTTYHQTMVPKTATTARPEAHEAAAGFFAFGLILKVLLGIVATIILVAFFKPQATTIMSASVSSFWQKVLLGFVILIVVPFAVLASFVTVVAAPLGLIVLFGYVTLLLVSSLMSLLTFAELCNAYLFKSKKFEPYWWVIALSGIALGALSLIPFVGWLFGFVIFLAAFGSTADYLSKKLMK